MDDWLRRLRGALGMGLAFGLAWFGAGLAIMLVFLVTTGTTGADVPYPIGFGAFGFVAGVLFSGALGLLERSRTFEEMSIPRFAGLGALGGGLLAALFVTAVSLIDDPAFFQNLTVLVPVFAGAGGASAAGALALARGAKDEGGDALPPPASGSAGELPEG